MARTVRTAAVDTLTGVVSATTALTVGTFIACIAVTLIRTAKALSVDTTVRQITIALLAALTAVLEIVLKISTRIAATPFVIVAGITAFAAVLFAVDHSDTLSVAASSRL